MSLLYSMLPAIIALLLIRSCQSRSQPHLIHQRIGACIHGGGPTSTPTTAISNHLPPPSPTSSSPHMTFIPRGGAAAAAALFGKRTKKSKTPNIPPPPPPPEVDTEDEIQDHVPLSHPSLQEKEKTLSGNKEELKQVKETKSFMERQRRRRELDKTWLDKGITALIEFFENLFRWEVVE